MRVVFLQPTHRIARQSVLSGQRGDPAIFHPAEPALGGGPKSPVRIQPKVLDIALTQTVGGPIRCSHAAVLKIRHPALKESEPEPTVLWIGNASHRRISSELGPRKLLDRIRFGCLR